MAAAAAGRVGADRWHTRAQRSRRDCAASGCAERVVVVEAGDRAANSARCAGHAVGRALAAEREPALAHRDQGHARSVPQGMATGVSGCVSSNRGLAITELAISRPAGVEGATFAFERVDQHRCGATRDRRHVAARLPQHAGWPPCHQAADGRTAAVSAVGRSAAHARSARRRARAALAAWRALAADRVAGRSGRAVGDPSGHGRPAGTGEQRRHPHRTARGLLDAVPRGGGVGPAILYWAELVVFIVIAVLLGRYIHRR